MPDWDAIAGLLEYPGPGILEEIDGCRARLAPIEPEAADLLDRFRAEMARLGQGGREELYTKTFDMAPDRTLYAGHHLFGDDPRRGFFLSRLKEHYEARGFDCGKELPDHLGLMLRFVAANRSDEETGELIRECMVPALGKALAGFKDADGVYAAVLQAILLLVERETKS